MNPILLCRQVSEGLKDLVRSSFEIASPAFGGMIETFFEEPANFLKGPWISVGMPFREDPSGVEPFPEIPLGFAPYLHQTNAFARLRGESARSTLVATGTGSGKSEAYLLPILDHCRAHLGEPGIKAIIIYPMNALAGDQARRIAKLIATTPSLAKVRCGIYADAEPENATDVVTETDVITSRDAMRQNPPDILLTNYKMLDYLLLRGRDRGLWAKNKPTTLRYLVVDELHTFDGAQGADLALLVRRLKARLRTPANHLACVGSSATLGTGEEAERQLVAYAQDLFGETFGPGSVIREDRKSASEFLRPAPDFTDPVDRHELAKALETAERQTQGEAAQTLAEAVFGEAYDDAFKGLEDPDSFTWRERLGEALRDHIDVQAIIEALNQGQGPLSFERIVEILSGKRRYGAWNPAEMARLAEAVIALISWARTGTEKRPSPFLNVRVQIWAREMTRMVASLPRRGEEGVAIRLAHSDDLDVHDLKRHLPVVHCAHCGTAGHLSALPDRGRLLSSDLRGLYKGFFDGSDRTRILYHEPVGRLGDVRSHGAVFTAMVDTETLELDRGAHRDDPEARTLTPVWIYDPVTTGGSFDRTCPACGSEHSLQILGLRAQRLTAALTTALFNSEHHEADPDAKPRVLMFSDSVQDAAQRAAVAEIRNTGSVIRKSLYQALIGTEERERSLKDISDALPGEIRVDLGDEAFVARFIGADQTWQDGYKALQEKGRLGGGSLPRQVEARLGWEYVAELTYRSRSSQTLESARLLAVQGDPARIELAAEAAVAGVQAHVSPVFALTLDEMRVLIAGLLDEMRRRGAIDVDYLRLALENATSQYGLNYFAAQANLGLAKLNALPIPQSKSSAAPRPPTKRTNITGFQSLVSPAQSNWYAYWMDRFFLQKNPLAPAQYGDLFDEILKRLEAQDLVRKRISTKDPKVSGWLVNPELVSVSVEHTTIACDRCQRHDVVLLETADWARPCRRIGCTGTMHPVREGARASASPYLESLFSTSRNHRVVAREHTGILEAEDRRKLETDFIKGEEPWNPNLISATPTLEMGIDIGDLSSLLLCSVPPEAANYVQRIGRTGRRDGNSLNVTIAMARPHDLQFWEEPWAMLAGQVATPGVHLGAVAVLRRQLAAYSLDCFVAGASGVVEYGKVSQVLTALEKGVSSSFVLDWFAAVEKNGVPIANEFLAFLPAHVRERSSIRDALTAYMTSGGSDSLRWHVRKTFDDAVAEREALKKLQNEIDNERKRLERLSPQPKDLKEKLEELRAERGEISRVIRERINDVDVLRFLTDRGVLPNYAFPEEGVKLKSIITRRASGFTEGERAEGKHLILREYVRPASSALSELAPFQKFYAEGREVEVNRIDLDTREIETWRFCPNCSHTSLDSMAKDDLACPKCGDPMWADSGEGGSARDVVELRTVAAVRPEDKAAIGDEDERDNERYVRKMFPAYEPGKIEVAYAVSGDADTPFGYEFVSACEFRDVNFGVEKEAPSGQSVAGEPLKAFPFEVCRHCGRLQDTRFKPLRPGDPGDHQARCKAVRNNLPLDDWRSKILLMRRFSTEALRIVMPVAGAASDDAIKSFVAAFDLGMRKHFAGRIDHLRSVIVEERFEGEAGVRSLYIYDSVPGGSGYMRQIAEDPATLKRVFIQAREVLRTCPCEGEGRDGCHRCVKSYRSQFGAGTPSRSLGLVLMEAALSSWDRLARVERSINDDLRDSVVTSALEKRFVDALSERYGASSLKPILIGGAKRAFQLAVKGEDGRSRYWTLEAQVQIDKRFPGVPKKRIDFLLTPTGGIKAKPIVVELDGWEYHAAKTAEDLETRLLLVRSGHVNVVTLAWADLGSEKAIEPPNPFAAKSLGPAFEGTLGTLWSHEKLKDLRPARTDLELMISGKASASPFESLCARLEGYGGGALAPALLTYLVVGPKGADFDALPGIAALNEDARLFLREGAKHHRAVSADLLTVYMGHPGGQPTIPATSPESFRVVLRADFPANIEAVKDRPSIVAAWRGMWRLVTLFQDLPGFHVVFPGLDNLSTPVAASPRKAQEEAAWDEIETYLDGRALRIVQALRAAGGPLPDTIGEDVMVGDMVGGVQVELGWKAHRVGLVYDDLGLEGWDLIRIDDSDEGPVSGVVERIMTRTAARAAEGVE